MNTRIRTIVLLLALLMLISRNGISISSPISTKITEINYVYERDQHVVPQEISLWLREVNDKTEIRAFEMDDDTVDPSGNQRLSVVEAKKAGIPCLIVMSDTKVVKTVSDPKTREQLKGIVPEVY